MPVKPYTHIVGWPEQGAWYYGVRFANKLPAKEDLWGKYFTSSKTGKGRIMFRWHFDACSKK